MIDCGVGNDTARVDAGDVVSNCETVETGGSQAVGLTLPSRLSLRTLAAGHVRIGVACRAKCMVAGRLIAPRSLKRKLKLDGRRSGSGHGAPRRRRQRDAATAGTATVPRVREEAAQCHADAGRDRHGGEREAHDQTRAAVQEVAPYAREAALVDIRV